MTKRESQLLKDGYSFTGIYERSKKIVKERAIQKRKDGYFAVVVTIPDSKYSRGYVGVGYSVYAKPTEKKIAEMEAEEKAKIDKTLADISAINSYLFGLSKDALSSLFIETIGDRLNTWAREKGIIN